jgi:hypothetical protein
MRIKMPFWRGIETILKIIYYKICTIQLKKIILYPLNKRLMSGQRIIVRV